MPWGSWLLKSLLIGRQLICLRSLVRTKALSSRGDVCTIILCWFKTLLGGCIRRTGLLSCSNWISQRPLIHYTGLFCSTCSSRGVSLGVGCLGWVACWARPPRGDDTLAGPSSSRPSVPDAVCSCYGCVQLPASLCYWRWYSLWLVCGITH